jgi:hypothetical protein
MNREVHVRFWESPEVKVLRATRHDLPTPLIVATAAAPRHVGIVAGVEDLGSNLERDGLIDPVANARFQPADQIEADVGDFVHPQHAHLRVSGLTPAVCMFLGPG